MANLPLTYNGMYLLHQCKLYWITSNFWSLCWRLKKSNMEYTSNDCDSQRKTSLSHSHSSTSVIRPITFFLMIDLAGSLWTLGTIPLFCIPGAFVAMSSAEFTMTSPEGGLQTCNKLHSNGGVPPDPIFTIGVHSHLTDTKVVLSSKLILCNVVYVTRNSKS